MKPQEELLKEQYLQHGYEEKYFDYFFNFYWAEFDDNEDESLSFQTSCQFMEIFKSQLSLGHSEEWANNYACLKLYSIDFDITKDSLVGEMLEGVLDERHDLEIFVKEFNQDEIFNYAYIESWMHEILSAPEYMDNYTFALEYSKKYHKLIQEGKSDVYAKAWLRVEYMPECNNPDMYATAYDTAIQHGCSDDKAFDFAGDVCFLYIDIYSEDVEKERVKLQTKYTEDWQKPFLEYDLEILYT
jgi:hypothetical protein